MGRLVLEKAHWQKKLKSSYEKFIQILKITHNNK